MDSRPTNLLERDSRGKSMKHNVPVFTLALLGAIALAALSGGLLVPSGNVAHADHIDAQANETPVFKETGTVERSIAENTPAGVNIGAPVAATDEDDDTLTYTLEGTNAASFDIDGSTGQLITKEPLNNSDEDANGTDLDVTVKADDGTDNGSSSATKLVTITVTNADEPPAAPAPPIVTTGAVSGSETTVLEVNWYVPANIGPTITDYDYRYKKETDNSWTEVDNTSITATNTTIMGLEADTAYQVSVRAKNGEADSTENWSLSATGSTNKEGNAAPEFPASENGQRSVAENTPSGQRVGAAVTATDANSTTLKYSLAGADADSFEMEELTGQIKTKADLNHEGKPSYAVFVIVSDDGDGGSDVIAVAITVANVSERPSQPARPTVKTVEDNPDTPADESTTSLEVTWVTPETPGPAITMYDIEYRKGTSGPFSDDNCGETGNNNCLNITETTTTITGLEANESYQVRVKADSDEQDSQWSLPGTGRTTASNNAPVFSTDTLTRTVRENTPAGRNIGAQIRATDPDTGDTLTYSLESDNCDGGNPDDLCAFDIDASTGQLKTKDALDHEAKSTYNVTVTVTDRKGLTDTIEVTITVQDVNEPPLAPSKPTVTVDTGSPTDTLDVTWTAPDNTGRPVISEYKVQYRVSGSWNSVSDVGTNTSAEISGLNPFTNYQVQVRAVNDEGDSPWVSSSERTSKENNALPEFTGSSAREVQENTVRGLPVGDPVTADDDDDDTLNYSLGGVDADLFDIDGSSGQIKVKAGLDHEAECGDADNHETTCTYSVDVKVVDGNGGSATASITITVTDDDTEEPSAPSRPTVIAAAATDDEPNLDPTTMLTVSWSEPGNEGPSITEYAVQYKVSGSPANFLTTNITFYNTNDGTTRVATITALEDDTSYEVQVMATNGEGMSGWSVAGTGRTRFANTRPRFSRDAYTLRVDENTPSGRSIGRPVAATDDDGHVMTYTLEGVNKDLFSIESRSGHVRTRASLDYEDRNSYSLTVRATDTEGGSAAVSVTVLVDNEDESPLRPAAPTVSGIAGSTSSVRVSWSAPSNDGRPSITDYDVWYRKGSESFGPHRHDGTDTSTIITGLNAGTTYEVQVLAWNSEGESERSPSGSGSPNPDPANNAPSFSGGPRTFSIAENTDAGTNIGGPVTATDPDRDQLTYTLEGTDAASFYIDPSLGQIQTSAPLNHEEQASHSVTVKADDHRGGTDTVAVTITVTDVPGEAPETPDAPTVAGASSTSVMVSWVAPDNPGPPISDYDYRYKEPTAGNWDEVTNTQIAGTTATISSLRADTSYEVQVRARNAEGTSEWSASGTGFTNLPGANNPPVFTEGASATRIVSEDAATGTNVGSPVSATDPDQGDTLTYALGGADAASFTIVAASGQLQTSAALDQETRSTYTVTVTATDTAGASDSITVTINVTQVVVADYDCARGAVADQSNTGLVRDCEALLGARNKLEGNARLNWSDVSPIAGWEGITLRGTPERVAWVDLRAKGLSGTVPAELGQLSMLTYLNLRTNDLSGPIPDELGRLTNLQKLLLHDNGLSGGFPNLRGLRNLTHLWLSGRDHSVGAGGGVPTWLNGLTSLVELNLWGNEMGGTIPNLSALTSLKLLKLQNNSLTGTIPTWFGSMNSLGGLYLHNNDLTGSIPSELGRLTTLRRLWIDRNDLTGTIPPQLGNMSNLGTLNLHTNQLTGSIPTELGNLSKLQHFGLHNNQLTGTIPTGLGNLSELTRIAVSNNRLTGTIPAGLGGLDKLTLLWLSQNQLTGTIPSALGDLGDTLTSLRLGAPEGSRGNTGLTGCVPRSLAGATDDGDLSRAGSAGLSICQ